MNEIIDVLLRILSVLILFISCGLLVYFSHEKLKVSLINQQDPIVTVPLDAGIVVESNKLKATLLNMSETNLIWSKLLEYQAFKEFDRLIKELDVFITKEQIIDESLNNKKIYSINNFFQHSIFFQHFFKLLVQHDRDVFQRF